MQFKNIQEIDLKLLLLSGETIKVENLDIVPYKLVEINRYGYTRYRNNIQLISLTIDDFIESIEDESKKEFLIEQKNSLKTFDFYIKLGGKELYDSLVSALSMIFRTDDVIVLDDGKVAINLVEKGIFSYEDGVLTVNRDVLDSIPEEEITIVSRENFDDIVSVVKLQNYLDKPNKDDDNDFNPANDDVRKLQEHMQKMREKVAKAKKQQQMGDGDDKEIDISDIISAISSKSNSINKLNIWDLTLYQVYDEYARLELIDSYDFSLRAIMAGAEKVDLKHWSSKL